MKHTIALLCCMFVVAAATAGPLEEKKAQSHLQSVAAGNIETLMLDYAEDAYMDWKKFIALNDGQPRSARFGKFSQQANAKGVTLEIAAEYVGKTTVKVQHVMVYREGVLTTEVWQIDPALKVGE